MVDTPRSVMLMTHPLVSQFLPGGVLACTVGDDFLLHGVFTKGRDGENTDHDVQDDGECEAEDEFEDELALLNLMPARHHCEEGACK